MTEKPNETPQEARPAGPAASPEGRDVRTLSSAQLFADAREVIIEHQNDRYRLRCTSKGKLILTK